VKYGLPAEAGDPFTLSLCSKVAPKGDEVDALIRREPDQVSTFEERSLLSFQRPVPLDVTA
jgi:hypothetical protein